LREVLTSHGLFTEIIEDPLPKQAVWDSTLISEYEKREPGNTFHPDFFPIGITNRPSSSVSPLLFRYNNKTQQKENIIGVAFDEIQEMDILPTPHVLIVGGAGSGKTVLMRNMLLGALLRPSNWLIAGVDLKKVEFNQYKKYSNTVLGVATTLEDTKELLSSVVDTMMERYEFLMELGANNIRSIPVDSWKNGIKPKRIMVAIDEIGELLPRDSSKQSKNDSEVIMNKVAEIARLGRAAGIHLVVSTQLWPSGYNELLANFGGKIICGKISPTQLERFYVSNDLNPKPNPKGRALLQQYNQHTPFQVFFSEFNEAGIYLNKKNSS